MSYTTNRSARLSAALALGVAAFIASGAALAQCDAGDGGIDPITEGTLRDSFPADQGMEVPLNSPVRLRYFGRVPQTPVLCVRRDSLDAACLDGSSAVVGDEIVWQPLAGPGGSLLQASRRYYVTYQEEGSGGSNITFVTGRGVAPERLTFGGITDAKADDAPSSDCDPEASDITVKFDRAGSGVLGLGDTPWPESDLEYVIYETRGPGISGPRERDRVRLQRSGSSVVSGAQRTFRLSGADASGPVCFNVQVLDPLGIADGNTSEQCVNPAKGNYFAGCSATPARGGSHITALALAACAALVTRRRRR